jgi:hypothetical protein
VQSDDSLMDREVGGRLSLDGSVKVDFITLFRVRSSMIKIN